MLKDDIVTATKLTVVATSDSKHSGEVKGKRDGTTRAVGVNATPESRGAPVTIMRLEDQEIGPPRVRGRIIA